LGLWDLGVERENKKFQNKDWLMTWRLEFIHIRD